MGGHWGRRGLKRDAVSVANHKSRLYQSSNHKSRLYKSPNHKSKRINRQIISRGCINRQITSQGCINLSPQNQRGAKAVPRRARAWTASARHSHRRCRTHRRTHMDLCPHKYGDSITKHRRGATGITHYKNKPSMLANCAAHTPQIQHDGVGVQLEQRNVRRDWVVHGFGFVHHRLYTAGE